MRSNRLFDACVLIPLMLSCASGQESRVAVEPSTTTTQNDSKPGVLTHSALFKLFTTRDFSLDSQEIPNQSATFPVDRLRNVVFKPVAKFDWFPEGPAYRATDGSYFFSGSQALTRISPSGQLHELLGRPAGGGLHFLPDGSVLIIGHVGLRRLFPDGRIALLADGNNVGGGNDLSIGIHQEIYFSVPKSGIYRLTAGTNGELRKVADRGCNGLEVDLAGQFLYVVRSAVERYKIDIESGTLGKPQVVYEFPKGQGGGDGCTFDAWGNLYSVHFRSGTIRVINPNAGKLIAKIPVGVVPASNLTFGGSKNSQLLVTAGSPKTHNCQILKSDLGVIGFCGHLGSTSYPEIGFLEPLQNTALFSPDATK